MEYHALNKNRNLQLSQAPLFTGHAAVGTLPNHSKYYFTTWCWLPAVTKKRTIRELIRRLGAKQSTIDLTVEGKVVARLVPPGELSEEEKAEVLDKGWEFVERARTRNRGVPEREIMKTVKAAVNRVRSKQ